MKIAALAFAALVFAASFAGARGRGASGRSSVGRGFSGGGFSRSMSGRQGARPPLATPGALHRTYSNGGGFARANGRASFSRAARLTAPAAGGGTGAPVPTAPTTPTTPAAPAAPPQFAAPGSKIVAAGQPPTYSNAGGAGSLSVDGGGFIAIDQGKAVDVARSPGISWGPPDRLPSSGGSGGGSGASANGPIP